LKYASASCAVVDEEQKKKRENAVDTSTFFVLIFMERLSIKLP
jgi:hypothetical protein